jgi:23S rRNA (pseudouridine1915-N3)-methyltransferase
MKLVVIAAGKLKEREVRVIADDYLGRIRRYVKCDEIEVKSAKDLAAAVPDGALLVALEVAGDALTSTELSRRVERWGSTGKGIVAFIIGDAQGAVQERLGPH